MIRGGIPHAWPCNRTLRTGCCRIAVTPVKAGLAQPDLALRARARDSCADDPAALKDLGARLVVGRDAPCSPVDGAALIDEAAQRGNADAWHYLALLAVSGVGRRRSLHLALDALQRAADLGHGHAARQIRLLEGAGILALSDLEHWLSPPPMRVVHDRPKFSACAAFLSPSVCRHLRAYAAPRLVRAKVYDVHQHRLKADPMRTNTGSALSLMDTDVIIQLVRQRIARAADTEPAALEPPEILHYSPGEQYRLHVDFFHASVPHFAEAVRVRGQRIRTCLVYLNTGYDSGETDFPRLGFRFRGDTGEALIFSNVDAAGEGDMMTAHAGLPPASGEKWLFSQWIRSKPQPVV